MSVPLPNLTLSGQSASESRLNSGDVFNFNPPQKVQGSNMPIYVTVAIVAAAAFFAIKSRI